MNESFSYRFKLLFKTFESDKSIQGIYKDFGNQASLYKAYASSRKDLQKMSILINRRGRRLHLIFL